MSTHCYIGLEHVDGTITYMYCQFDGYPSYVGKRLYTYYSKRDTITTLVTNGSIVSLELPIHDMIRIEPAQTWTAMNRYEFESSFYQRTDISYYYLFTMENEWICKIKDTISLHELYQ